MHVDVSDRDAGKFPPQESVRFAYIGTPPNDAEAIDVTAVAGSEINDQILDARKTLWRRQKNKHEYLCASSRRTRNHWVAQKYPKILRPSKGGPFSYFVSNSKKL